jgi:hypothetical protein
MATRDAQLARAFALDRDPAVFFGGMSDSRNSLRLTVKLTGARTVGMRKGTNTTTRVSVSFAIYRGLSPSSSPFQRYV